MKYPYIVVFAMLVSMSSVIATGTGKHLLILSGQSNMARLDPDISFTPSVELAFGKEHVTVVKDAQGGQPIRRWYKNWKPAQSDKPKATGDLYDRLMKKVTTAAEGKEFTSVTLVWMQGESDAKQKHGEVYAASLNGLIKQLAQDLGREDINFVIGRISDFDMINSKFLHWTMVRDAQVEVAESNPRYAWVNTDDLNDGINEKNKPIKNDLHYSVKGYAIFGERLAEAAIKLIRASSKQSE